MDQSQSPCPTPEQLVQYHLGNVPAQFAQWIVDHISGCPKCAGTLKGIRAADRGGVATPAAAAPQAAPPPAAPAPPPAAAPQQQAARGLATLSPANFHREVIRPELLDLELSDPKSERENATKVALETRAEQKPAEPKAAEPKPAAPAAPPQQQKQAKQQKVAPQNQRATATIADVKNINIEELMASGPPVAEAPAKAPEPKPEPKPQPEQAPAKAQQKGEQPAKEPAAKPAAPVETQRTAPAEKKKAAPPAEAKPAAAAAKPAAAQGKEGKAKESAAKRRTIDDVPTAVLMDGKRMDPGDGDLSGSFDVESFWGLTAALEDSPNDIDLDAPKAKGDVELDEETGSFIGDTETEPEDAPPAVAEAAPPKPAEPAVQEAPPAEPAKPAKRAPTKEQARRKVEARPAAEQPAEEAKPKVIFSAPPPAEMVAPSTGTMDPSNPWGISTPDKRALNDACKPLAEAVVETGLLTQEGLQQFLDGLPKLPQTQETLAHELVRARHLNGFQAQMILTGRHDELSLGDYIVVEMLSQSGQGILYSAIHHQTRQPAAVKVFDREAYAASKAGSAASLQHEHIAQVLECGEGEETGFVATEILAGGDLAQLIRRERRLTLDRAVNYIIQAARGLQFAHQQGFVHGHIGPTNLLLGEGNKIKITDFGWAGLHPVPEMTPEGYEEERSAASMGEMQREDLCAPEIFSGHKPDMQTDIYGLGATLAYLLVGVPMRLDKSLEKAAGTVPNIKEYVRNTPLAVQKVFRRMVAKDRNARYKNYEQLIDMLQATLDPVRHPEIESAEANWGRTAGKAAAKKVKSALGSQLLWVVIALAAVAGLAYLAFR